MKYRLAYKTAFAVILVGTCLFVSPCTAQTQSDSYPASKDLKQPDSYPAVKDSNPQPKPSDNSHPGSYTPQSRADLNNTRREYADRVRETYNFHFGEGNISTPGNAKVVGDDSVQPGAFPARSIARNATRKLTASGGRRCTRTHFVRRFTARA
jgi:hypothetical protein